LEKLIHAFTPMQRMTLAQAIGATRDDDATMIKAVKALKDSHPLAKRAWKLMHGSHSGMDVDGLIDDLVESWSLYGPGYIRRDGNKILVVCSQDDLVTIASGDEDNDYWSSEVREYGFATINWENTNERRHQENLPEKVPELHRMLPSLAPESDDLWHGNMPTFTADKRQHELVFADEKGRKSRRY
jgi:hypothetical protein